MKIFSEEMIQCAEERAFFKRLVEKLADLEHEQWMHWSKAVADEVSPERRKRWEKYWIPYKELPEDVKEADREWARRVLEVISNELRDFQRY